MAPHLRVVLCRESKGHLLADEIDGTKQVRKLFEG
jgi:hypothetical protein